MGNNIFISHSVEDSEIARLVSSTLRMLSLKQIHTWYSSSDNWGEGFTPGDIWFTRICDEILKSKALIAILSVALGYILKVVLQKDVPIIGLYLCVSVLVRMKLNLPYLIFSYSN